MLKFLDASPFIPHDQIRTVAFTKPRCENSWMQISTLLHGTLRRLRALSLYWDDTCQRGVVHHRRGKGRPSQRLSERRL